MRYFLFSLGYLTLYGGLHVYAAHRAIQAFPRLRPALVAPLLGALALFPLSERLLERGGLWSAPLPLLWVAYVWMGFIFLFVSLLVVSDLMGWCARRISGPGAVMAKAKTRLGLVFLLAVILSCQAWLSAQQPFLAEVEVTSPKVPVSAGEIRIVQLADIHLGPMLDAKRLDRILAVAIAARPDLLVSTGDVVDGQLRHINGFSGRFAAIPAPLGKFAVLGNHEFYVGAAQSVTFLESAGFTVLRGGSRPVTGWLTLLGEDDAGASHGDTVATAVSPLRAVPASSFTLLLRHRPTVTADLADLQLSGHTHGGQIFPFGLLVRFFFPLPTGLVATGEDKYLYTSLGAGTWGPPMRLFARPEVTLIRLRHGEG